jgi:hypothetical protein
MAMRGPSRSGVWVDDTITDARGRRWTLHAWVVVRRGRPVVGELRIFPAGMNPPALGDAWTGEARDVPPHGLESRLLHRVPVGSYGYRVVDTIRRTTHPLLRDFRQWMLPGSQALASRPRPRRNVGRDDRFYSELAAAYVARLAEGSPSPVKDIAAARPGETTAHIRDMLHEARVRGLLSKGQAGKRDGLLLPRAIALLQRARA